MEEDRRLLERILDGAEDPRDLPFALLKDITNDFSEVRKIGEGGFGEVYKGVLGEQIVAVKRIYINAHTSDDKLFRSEVTILMNIKHRNVVQFLGVCSVGHHKLIEDGSGELIWANSFERLLCFKYISNGSLDKYISDELRGLEWEARYEIIIGICKGLHYLHKEKSIIHMDLKPKNILLESQDEKYMVPKITDIGLSRSNKHSHTEGQRYGTLEYMAPEYRDGGNTTQSCDIYSLGLIIIELVTGCKDVPNKDNVLRRWRHRWQKPPTQVQYQQVTRCIDIARDCRKKNPKDRPSISKIINFLRESESTYWQISPCLDEDDMLRITPLKLWLPSKIKSEISCSVELTNDTRNCIIAFNIQLPNTLYNAQPDKGIVRPESKYIVKIIVQAHDVGESDHVDKIIVQSMHVEASEGLRDEDIRERMSKNKGRFVDEVDLMVVYDSTKPQENFKCREDTTMQAEEVPEVVESCSNMVEIGIECTNLNPTKRPDTQHIMNMLDGRQSMDKYIKTDLITSEQAEHAPNKQHQGMPKSPGETSSKWKSKLSFQDLKDITNNFSDERILGKGGFGVVYKGLLDNGETVAVKKLLQATPNSLGQLENELILLKKLEHQNIVRLRGHCCETEPTPTCQNGKSFLAWDNKILLCLEYLPNGSLDKYIKDASLDWHTRWKIIEGISYGLQYLHEHSNEPIIHLDLKPANILLDVNMLPKITDFGLSRLFDQNKTICTASAGGTIGYMPPEYTRGKITPMWDIFSLGVIIMEVITGHRKYPDDNDIRNDYEGFIELELQKWRNRLQKEPGFTSLEKDCQLIERCIQIGLICMNPDRTKRPTIKKVIDMLEGTESMNWYIRNELRKQLLWTEKLQEDALESRAGSLPMAIIPAGGQQQAAASATVGMGENGKRTSRQITPKQTLGARVVAYE